MPKLRGVRSRLNPLASWCQGIREAVSKMWWTKVPLRLCLTFPKHGLSNVHLWIVLSDWGEAAAITNATDKSASLEEGQIEVIWAVTITDQVRSHVQSLAISKPKNAMHQ